MIGIKDTLELTAAIHGGKRLADRIHTKTHRSGRESMDRRLPLTKINAKTVSPLRKSSDMIVMPGISDELGRYRARNTVHRAA